MRNNYDQPVNLIGLNDEKSQALANELNALLAHYQVLYMNTRLSLKY